MLAARWYKKGENQEYTTGFAGWFDQRFGRFENGYQSFLRACLRHPWVTVFTGNAILVLIFMTVGSQLGFRFAPEQDRNSISISVEGPAGASLDYTTRICQQVENVIRSDKRLDYDTKFISTNVGQSAVGGEGSGSTGTQYATIQMDLWDKRSILDRLEFWKHDHLRPYSDADDAARVRSLITNISGAKIIAANEGGFGGGGAPLEVDVTGPDFNKLMAAASTVQNMIKAIPGTYDSDISFKNSQPEAQIRLDRVKAADYGLTLQTVANAIADSISGNIDSKYRDPVDGQQYNMRVALDENFRSNPQDVENVVVGYKSGTPIYVRDVAEVTIGAGPVKIDRLNRQRQIAVTAYLLPGVEVGNVSQKLQKELDATKFDQVSYTFGGEAQLIGQEGGYLATAVFLGIILSFMLMAALFNNLVYPLSIMLSLPQAWAGAIIALYIAKQPLSLIAMIGFVLLNGIVNKNAILLVDYTNTLRARGFKRVDALLVAGPTRMRPILMTTLAIVVSSLPTALALGRGAGFRQSLGIAVIGGVTLSLLVTPIVIPCAYLLFDNLTNWISRVIFRRPSPRIVDFDGPQVAFSGGYYDGNGNGGSNVWPPVPNEDGDQRVTTHGSSIDDPPVKKL